MTATTDTIIYCSGPMFSPADLWEQQNIAQALDSAGYPTYLPQRDGIEVAKVMNLLNNHFLTELLSGPVETVLRRMVFALDLYQLLERCQALVFNMDGRVPDGGSVVETASAYTAGKPIVIYKATPITMLGGYDNPMISGLAYQWKYVAAVKDIPAALAEAIAGTPPSAFHGSNVPPHIQDVIAYGRDVWDVLQAIRETHDGDYTALLGAVIKGLKERGHHAG